MSSIPFPPGLVARMNDGQVHHIETSIVIDRDGNVDATSVQFYIDGALYEVPSCDSCGSEGLRLTYSPEHGANFCDGCYAHNGKETSL